MKIVGMPVCPSDACEERSKPFPVMFSGHARGPWMRTAFGCAWIKAISRYISDTPGGAQMRTGCRGSMPPESKGEWMDTQCYVKCM